MTSILNMGKWKDIPVVVCSINETERAFFLSLAILTSTCCDSCSYM